MLDLAGNYFGTQWFDTNGLYIALDNCMPGGGVARSLVTEANDTAVSEEFFTSTRVCQLHRASYCMFSPCFILRP